MSSTSPSSSQPGALAILAAEHRALENLFVEFSNQGGGASARQALVTEICNALLRHSILEADVFYPAVRRLLKDRDLIDDAQAEHEVMADLVAQIQDGPGGDAELDRLMMALRDALETHLEQEEGDLFPRIEDADVDLEPLADRLLERQAELLREDL